MKIEKKQSKKKKMRGKNKKKAEHIKLNSRKKN